MDRLTAIWLSHPLSVETPAYGGGQGLKIEPASCIANGDTANTSCWTFPNHLGTHVDTPLHFFDGGMAVSDYSPDFWVFHNAQLMDIPCEDGRLICSTDLSEPICSKTDLLLLRTGFENYRVEPRYWQRNPGLDPELGKWLRFGFPNIRAVCIDSISITSRLHKQEGRIAHRTFLDPKGEGHPVLLVEDMALAKAPHSLSTVVITPLLVNGADAAPCTVLGFAP